MSILNNLEISQNNLAGNQVPEIEQETNNTDPMMEIGRIGKIGKEQIDEAMQHLTKYKNDKTNIEARIIENEKWYKLRHWEVISGTQKMHQDSPKPSSAWLFNAIENKHADVMDNYPQANILPRAEDDKESAKQLSEILPLIFERCEFEETYSNASRYKLKNGTAVYGVFWNNKLLNGLGDIDIKQIDLLNCFWDIRCKDIQKSRNFFTVDFIDNDILEVQYPYLKNKLGGGTFTIQQYATEANIDLSKTTPVIDWYYKVFDGTREIVHYCKFANDEVIYASENDPAYAERGFYDHGQYPFIFDTLFGVEGCAVGFGYIDVCKDPQLYIDKLNQIIIENAFMSGKKRFFVKKNGGINLEQFADWSNDFIEVEGNVDETNIREWKVDSISNFIIDHLQHKIEELKETSANTQYAQGSGVGGVTSASGIVAMQEASGKLSRDNIKSSYRSYIKINYLALELVRQFYDEPRTFRIDGNNNETKFVDFDNTNLIDTASVDPLSKEMTSRKPIFDIKVTAQKQSAFHTVAQNELAISLFNMGVFNPQLADQALMLLEAMSFEGKDQIIEKVKQGQTMFNMIQTLKEASMMMASQIDQLTGSTNMTQQMASYLMQGEQALGTNIISNGGQVNLKGSELGSDTTINQKAREKTANTTKVVS